MAALKTSIQPRVQKNSVTGAFGDLQEYKKEVAKTRSKVSDWDIILIPLTLLHPYEGNKPLRMNLIDELAESIRDIGLASPIATSRRDDGTYTILSGHRRAKAFELLNTKYPEAGYDYIPAWVVSDEKSKDAAYLSKIWFDTNVETRQLTTPEIFNMIDFYFKKVNTMTPADRIKLANRLRGKDEDSTNNQGKASQLNMAKYIIDSARIQDVPGWSESSVRMYIKVNRSGTPRLSDLLSDYKIPLTTAYDIARAPYDLQDRLIDVYFKDPTSFGLNKLKMMGENQSSRINYYTKDLKTLNSTIDTIRRTIARAEKELEAPEAESITAMKEILNSIELANVVLAPKLKSIIKEWEKET